VGWTCDRVLVWDLRRIRERLREIDLDWDLPPYPAENRDGVAPVSVALDLGDLSKNAASEPVDPGSCNNLAWQLATSPEPSLRDAERALRLARRAVEREPLNGNYRNTLGVAQYRNGEWEPAIRSLEDSMKMRNGGDSYDFFFLAMSHQRSGRLEEARRWYDRAIDWMDTNDPANEELRRFRIEAAELVGQSG
jgi:tetratricopeptide (TPR) repeat protein